MKIKGYKIEPGADLREADLRKVDLQWADLQWADLQWADLRKVDLREADLRKVDLREADLQEANLRKVNLRGGDLREADLRKVDLQWADLQWADLRKVNLRGADLREADLRKVNLREADLRGADLQWADLRGADLSQAKGLILSATWLKKYFKFNKKGCLIVYKAFGDTYYSLPSSWKIKPGVIINENVATERTVDCGCGINFATLDWIRGEYANEIKNKTIKIYQCYISPVDLADVVVPYNTDGKARCAKLKIGKEIKL